MRSPLFTLAGLGLVLVVCMTTACSSRSKTRRPRGVTPDEASAMATRLAPRLNRSTEGLVSVAGPRHTHTVDLRGRFEHIAVAGLRPDGSLSIGCVTTKQEAEAFWNATSAGANAAPSSRSPRGP